MDEIKVLQDLTALRDFFNREEDAASDSEGLCATNAFPLREYARHGLYSPLGIGHLGSLRGRTQRPRGPLFWAIATILVMEISTTEVTLPYLNRKDCVFEWTRPANVCSFPCNNQEAPF